MGYWYMAKTKCDVSRAMLYKHHVALIEVATLAAIEVSPHDWLYV